MDIKEEENLYCFNVSVVCHEFLESYIFFSKIVCDSLHSDGS